jgi:hypothetical protein
VVISTSGACIKFADDFSLGDIIFVVYLQVRHSGQGGGFQQTLRGQSSSSDDSR